MRYSIKSFIRKLPSSLSRYLDRNGTITKNFAKLGLRDFSVPITSPFFEEDINDKIKDIINNWDFLNQKSDFSSTPEHYLTIGKIKCVLSSLSGNISVAGKIKENIGSKNTSILYLANTPAKKIIEDVKSNLLALKKTFPTRLELSRVMDGLKEIEKLLGESEFRLVFSTSPWDIATMSMRGIDSCMRWDHMNHVSLVGSMLCPNTAILYVTDGKVISTVSHTIAGKISSVKTVRGEKMLFRSVVRLVQSRMRYGKLALFQEEEYQNHNEIYPEEEGSFMTASFNKELARRGKPESNLLPRIISLDTNTTKSWNMGNIAVPASKVINSLIKKHRNEDTLSYSDACIAYMMDKDCAAIIDA
jgi:hypothetical protein